MFLCDDWNFLYAHRMSYAHMCIHIYTYYRERILLTHRNIFYPRTATVRIQNVLRFCSHTHTHHHAHVQRERKERDQSACTHVCARTRSLSHSHTISSYLAFSLAFSLSLSLSLALYLSLPASLPPLLLSLSLSYTHTYTTLPLSRLCSLCRFLFVSYFRCFSLSSSISLSNVHANSLSRIRYHLTHKQSGLYQIILI